ncbi:PDR/VanB family oxidoreductase [Lysinimonas soli]|uniref:PDR/VanB family oxidoreductase n=1 Tax=Lysinimonas soli TaxID=1074233 RepID=A0ABW0NWN3_9MICO
MNRPIASDVDAVVIRRDTAVDGVVVFELAAREGQALPVWTPGSHVDVLLPSGLIRQYSLCGDPGADRWRLGVLREADARGGSLWMCDSLREGQAVRLAGPRNHFHFDPEPGVPVILLAAGIGITPILPMAAAARDAGIDYALHYSGHEGRMAFLPELAAAHGERLVTHLSERGERLELDAVLAAAAPGTRVYCCGPAGFIDAAERAAAAAGLDFHTERFEAETLTAPVWPEPFEVELALSGVTVTVPPERSILEVVEEEGVFVLSSCHEGTCGTCETPVLEGEIDHRDSILTPQERARGDVMFICVSRAACPRLVLDL